MDIGLILGVMGMIILFLIMFFLVLLEQYDKNKHRQHEERRWDHDLATTERGIDRTKLELINEYRHDPEFRREIEARQYNRPDQRF